MLFVVISVAAAMAMADTALQQHQADDRRLKGGGGYGCVNRVITDEVLLWYLESAKIDMLFLCPQLQGRRRWVHRWRGL